MKAPCLLTLVFGSALASTEILERLISLLLDVSFDLSDEHTQDRSDEIDLQRGHVVITLRGILLSLLRNAQFWELHNIRGPSRSFRQSVQFWSKFE